MKAFLLMLLAVIVIAIIVLVTSSPDCTKDWLSPGCANNYNLFKALPHGSIVPVTVGCGVGLMSLPYAPVNLPLLGLECLVVTALLWLCYLAKKYIR